MFSVPLYRNTEGKNAYQTWVEIGTPLQHNNHDFGFYLDYASSSCAVATAACPQCAGYYDQSLSSSYSASPLDFTLAKMWSNVAKVAIDFYGTMGKESLCLNHDETLCLTDYDFFKITEIDGVDYWPWNGILGLAPQASTHGPSIVTAFYNQGVIDKNIATIYYTRETDGSKLIFGGTLDNAVPIATHEVPQEWEETWSF